MKICILTTSKDGMSAKVYEHFGSAPYFTIIDTDNDKIEILDNANLNHTHGMCQPMDALNGKNIGVVISGGMGGRAVNKLNQGGIKVLRSNGITVEETVANFKSENLEPITIEGACKDHSCH
jgi:predicted Fe-Mo cluster-binding NifX family protein